MCTMFRKSMTFTGLADLIKNEPKLSFDKRRIRFSSLYLIQVNSKKKSPEKPVYQADTSSWNYVLSNISQQDRPTVNK